MTYGTKSIFPRSKGMTLRTAEAGATPRLRTHDALLKDLEADLRSGKIKVGDRLPGERALADNYGISRGSVREAIRILNAMGIVRSSVGSGPTSGAIVVSDTSAGLSSALRLHLASKRLSLADVAETRILLETWAAEVGAKRPEGGQDLEQAGDLMLAMDDPELDLATFNELDNRFHVALSSLAGNAVVTTMMESLAQSIVGYMEEATDTVLRWRGVVATLRIQHHGIFDAVKANNGELAARLLREHIEWFHHQTQAAVEGGKA